jgi:hypothetical protein
VHIHTHISSREHCTLAPVCVRYTGNELPRRLLSKATEAKDPVVRLQWTVTWFVAGLQHVFQVSALPDRHSAYAKRGLALREFGPHCRLLPALTSLAVLEEAVQPAAG